jgi:hypothetical protein
MQPRTILRNTGKCPRRIGGPGWLWTEFFRGRIATWPSRATQAPEPAETEKLSVAGTRFERMSEVTVLRPRGETEAPSLDELHKLSDGEIADQITTWAGRIAAGEARLLAYVGEF